MPTIRTVYPGEVARPDMTPAVAHGTDCKAAFARHDGAVSVSLCRGGPAPPFRNPDKISPRRILPARPASRGAALIQSVFIFRVTIVRPHVSGITFGRIDARPDQTEICEAPGGSHGIDPGVPMAFKPNVPPASIPNWSRSTPAVVPCGCNGVGSRGCARRTSLKFTRETAGGRSPSPVNSRGIGPSAGVANPCSNASDRNSVVNVLGSVKSRSGCI